jgi:hypothetical protein
MIILFFCLTLSAATENVEAKRSSYVGMSATRSSSEYQDQRVQGSLGLSEQWLFDLGFFRSDSGMSRTGNEELVSTELRAGGDFQAGDQYGFKAEAIHRKDPYELLGVGAGLGGNYGLHTIWGGELLTDLSFKVESIRYQQQIKYTGPLASLTIDRDVTQRLYEVALTQEVNRWFLATLAIRRYNYTEGINRLLVTTARRQTTFSRGRNSYGLPDREQDLSVTISSLSWVSLKLGVARSQLVNADEEIKSRRSELTFYWQDFDLALEYAYSDFGDTSVDDESVQEFGSVSLGYQF